MTRKQFALLLVIVIVIGAAGLIIRQRGTQSWQSTDQSAGQKLLPGLSVNDVAQITVKSGTNQLDLARRDNLWRVMQRGGYPANFQQISDLLLKLADLKIIQSDSVQSSELGRYDLLAPGTNADAGTLLQLDDASGKTLASLTLGKQHLHKAADGNPDDSWPDGRYLMNTGGNSVDLISDPLDSVQASPANWLDKDFFTIENPGAISVQYPDATNSWELTRASDTNDWQLADAKPGEKLDPSKISGVTSPFTSASFNDVLAGDTVPATNVMANATVITVKTMDGLTYTVRIGKKMDDNYPLTLAVTAADNVSTNQAVAGQLAKAKTYDHWFYAVPTYTIDPLLQTRSQLLETNTPASK